MNIKTKTEREYVHKYVLMVSWMFGLLPREVEVVAAFVYRYRVLERARAKFSSKQKREDYDPMVELKKPETIKLMRQDLGMDFDVFRGYVKRLKDKGVFRDGSINSKLLPGTSQTEIKIWMQ